MVCKGKFLVIFWQNVCKFQKIKAILCFQVRPRSFQGFQKEEKYCCCFPQFFCKSRCIFRNQWRIFRAANLKAHFLLRILRFPLRHFLFSFQDFFLCLKFSVLPDTNLFFSYFRFVFVSADLTRFFFQDSSCSFLQKHLRRLL